MDSHSPGPGGRTLKRVQNNGEFLVGIPVFGILVTERKPGFEIQSPALLTLALNQSYILKTSRVQPSPVFVGVCPDAG